MELEPKIGLEIHLELKTQTKLFCDCPNDSNETHPNVNICEICTGQPGILPTVNKKVVESAILLAKALNCQLNKISFFVRKNYFYPDLPKNYQISQYEIPLAQNGYLSLPQKEKKIRIRRIHLEEDTGRLIHQANNSLVDFNRSGIPLLEIVTEPDINSSEEAKEFIEEFILLVRYLKIAEANPEKGEIRFEANISLAPAKSQVLGTKVEVKNLGSIKSLKDAIDYEIKRQTTIYQQGGEIVRETRGFDENKRITYSQRWKEEAEDYRYFPEPDLPPLVLTESYLDSLFLPELPLQRRERLMAEYNLSFKQADLLVKNKDIGEFFEATISELKAFNQDFDIHLVYNYVANDIPGLLEKFNKDISDLDFTPADFAFLLAKLQSGEITTKILKDSLKEIIEKNVKAKTLIEERKIIKDAETIYNLIDEIIQTNPKAVDDYRRGKESALQFLIGELLKKTQGGVDISLSRQLFIQRLKND